MAKFKKLAMLCTALLATASLTFATGCSLLDGVFGTDNSNSESSSVEESTDSSDDSSTDSSDDSSTDSSDDSSSGTEDDTVYYKNVVDGAAGSLSATAMGSVWGEISFEATEAGLYGIYAVDADFNLAGVSFGAQGETDADACSARYLFEVEEAGTVTLAATYFAWDEGTLEYNYYVYQISPLVVSEAEGSAALVANLPAPVKVVAPAAGKYVLSITKEVIWATSMSDLAAGGTYGSKTEIVATEADEEITLYVVYENMDDEGFDFEWTLAEKAIPVLAMGDNNLTLANGEDTEMTFTPAEDGVYTFTATNENCMIGVWNDNYGGYIDYDVSGYSNTASLNATTEGLTVYVKYSNYDDPTPIEETITVSAFESANPAMTEVGNYTFTATADGLAVSFTAPAAGTYSIVDGYKYVLWFADTVDGGDGSGESGREVTLAEGETINFTIKYDGLITISIEKLPDIVNLNLGENTVNVPEGESTLQFNVGVGEYVLTYDNDNVVSMINGWEPYVEGTMFGVSYFSSYTISSTDGSALENVTFTLAEFVYPTVDLGDNTISAGTAGTTYKFTATEVGCYTFTVVGEKVNYVTLNADKTIYAPDALEGAGTISIDVKAGAEIDFYIEASEDCEVSVNVAYNTTVNPLESSITMNAEGTQPESLTIESLPNGACVYYVAMRMVGDYIISWDSSINLVVYAGDNVGMSMDKAEVRLTRTMMDAGVYLIVRNSDYEGANYENVVLNFAVYEEPAAEPQGQIIALDTETTIEIAAWGDAIISFVAEEAGTYTLTTASSVLVDYWQYNENWQSYDRTWTNPIDSTEGGSFSFSLEAGEIIDFFVMEYDMGAVSFVFTITKN